MLLGLESTLSSPSSDHPHASCLLCQLFLVFYQLLAHLHHSLNFLGKFCFSIIEITLVHLSWATDPLSSIIKRDSLHTSWKENDQEEPSKDHHQREGIYLESNPDFKFCFSHFTRRDIVTSWNHLIGFHKDTFFGRITCVNLDREVRIIHCNEGWENYDRKNDQKNHLVIKCRANAPFLTQKFKVTPDCRYNI